MMSNYNSIRIVNKYKYTARAAAAAAAVAAAAAAAAAAQHHCSITMRTCLLPAEVWGIQSC